MYGLRGVRVGEASHPNLPKLRILGGDESQYEVPSTMPASDGTLGALDRERSSDRHGQWHRMCRKFRSTITVVLRKFVGRRGF